MSEIILIYPGKQWMGSVTSPYPPLPLLPIAGILEKNGFKVKLIDMQIENYKTMKLGEALYIGITTRTGRQISYGLEVAKFVREKDPDLKIIWGGVHPSLLPEQTLINKYVDLLVRGEGDLTIVELTKKIDGNKLKHIEKEY